MTNIEIKSKIFAVATVALLALGAGTAASAQGVMLPNTDIRALEPPVDVTQQQLNAFHVPLHQGRSIARDGRFEAVPYGSDQDR